MILFFLKCVTLSAATSVSLVRRWAWALSMSSSFKVSLRMLSSCMRCQFILHFTAVFRHSPGSSLSTRDTKDYRIEDPTRLEQRIDDVRAIMDAIGFKRAALFGHSEGCPMSALFAATYPGFRQSWSVASACPITVPAPASTAAGEPPYARDNAF
jgi:pimeloyl-ACP methyl ester carboxylesterase